MKALTALQKINDRFNQATLLAVREELARMGVTDRAEQDAELNRARWAQLIFLEGAERPLPEREREAGFWEHGQFLAFAGIRQPS